MAEIRYSLRTTDYGEALRRGQPILDYLNVIFTRRDALNLQDVIIIAKRFGEERIIPPALLAHVVHIVDRSTVDLLAQFVQERAKEDREAAKYGEYEGIKKELQVFCKKNGLELDPKCPNYYLLLKQALLACSQADETNFQRVNGDLDDLVEHGLTPFPVSPPILTAPVSAVPAKALTVAEACEVYIHEKSKTEGAWNEGGTLQEVSRALKRFCNVVGTETPVASLTHQMLMDFKTKLALFPKQTLKRYAGKTVAELLEMDVPDKDRIEKGTMHTQLTWVTALCDWAATHDYMHKSITKGIGMKRSTVDKHRRTDCAPYAVLDVQTIFHSECFTYNPHRLERFWGPLISAHSSGRLNEVGQLLVEDVGYIGGVLCFKVKIEEDKKDQEEKGKKLKTQASKRNIPVHKLLLELGFEEYVDGLRAAGEVRLFPNLPSSKRGHGVELGKWYGREITAKLFPGENRRKVFNSFRHTVEDQFKNMLDMRDSMQSYITGHATSALDFDLYGSDPMATNLRIFVDRIDYGLNIEILKAKMANPEYTRRGRAPRRKAGVAEASPPAPKSRRGRKPGRKKDA